MMYRLLLPLVLTGCASFGNMNNGALPPTKVVECVGPECASGPVELEDPVATVSETFAFESHGAKLEGEIVRPTGIDGPLPAVVILHDFGPFHRDGLVKENFGVQLPAEVPVYRALAEDLAAVGFAVLIYDKRTCVTGGKVYCAYPRTHLEAYLQDPAVLQDDAIAAIEALRARRDIQTNYVAVVGHGQGADLAFGLEKRGVTPNAIVALNPSATPPSGLVLHQLRTTQAALKSRLEAENTAETDEMRKQVERVEQSLVQAESAFAGQGEFGGVSGKLWNGLDALHAQGLTHAKASKVPTMVLVGSLDYNAPDDDEERLRGLLGDRPFWVALEGVGHDLVDLTDDATTLSEDVTQNVVEFLKSPGR